MGTWERIQDKGVDSMLPVSDPYKAGSTQQGGLSRVLQSWGRSTGSRI